MRAFHYQIALQDSRLQVPAYNMSGTPWRASWHPLCQIRMDLCQFRFEFQPRGVWISVLTGLGLNFNLDCVVSLAITF